MEVAGRTDITIVVPAGRAVDADRCPERAQARSLVGHREFRRAGGCGRSGGAGDDTAPAARPRPKR